MESLIEGARVQTGRGHGTVLTRRGMMARVEHDGGPTSWVPVGQCVPVGNTNTTSPMEFKVHAILHVCLK